MDTEYRGKRDRWSPEIVERIKVLWAEGRSAGKIADLLPGGFTRNAIIGKARRLGLDGRASPIIRTPGPAQPLTAAQRMRKTRAARQAAALAERQAATVESAPEPRPVWNIEPAQRRAVGPAPTHALTLDETQDRRGCLWPVNDGRPFLFCGHDRSESSGVYCGSHHKRAVSLRSPDLSREFRR